MTSNSYSEVLMKVVSRMLRTISCKAFIDPLKKAVDAAVSLALKQKSPFTFVFSRAVTKPIPLKPKEGEIAKEYKKMKR